MDVLHVDLAVRAVRASASAAGRPFVVTRIVCAIGGHDRPGPLGHVRLLLHIRVVPDQVGMEHAVCRRRGALADELHVAVPVGGERQGLAGPDVVERRFLRVDDRERLLGALVLEGHHPSVRSFSQREGGFGVGRDYQVEVPRGQPLRSDGGVGDRIDLNTLEVDVRCVGRPVVGVANQHGLLVLDPALDHERTGADGHLVQGGICKGSLDPLRRQDHPELASEIVREPGRGPHAPVLDGVVVDLAEGLVGVEPGLEGQRDDRISELRRKRRDHIVGFELGAVVEADSFPQLHVPVRAVADLGPRLGQNGDPVALLVVVGERVENRVGHDVGRHRKVVGRGVQAVALGLDAYPKRAAELRLGLGRRLGDRCAVL